MDSNLTSKINQFLKKSDSSNDRDHASCSQDDFQILSEIFHELMNSRFGRYDGSIELVFVNRKTHESVQYLPIPYMHKAKTEDEINEIIETAGVNVSIASDRLSQLLKARRSEVERIKNRDISKTRKPSEKHLAMARALAKAFKDEQKSPT